MFQRTLQSRMFCKALSYPSLGKFFSLFSFSFLSLVILSLLHNSYQHVSLFSSDYRNKNAYKTWKIEL